MGLRQKVPTHQDSGGDKWEDAIEDALKEVTEGWVLLTDNAVTRSIWVHQELGFFYGYNIEKDLEVAIPDTGTRMVLRNSVFITI